MIALNLKITLGSLDILIISVLLINGHGASFLSLLPSASYVSGLQCSGQGL